LNKHPVEPVPEYEGDWLQLVDNTPEAYRAAIQRLMDDNELRRAQGERAYRHAHDTFDPEAMEGRIVDVFKGVLGWN
jgi:glycosyltransferase involved in cell wall biosynthesis